MASQQSAGKKDGCAGCNRPDEADNMVQCDSCDVWWHFSCAGVSGSITDRSWVCTRCQRCLSRPSSKVSVASRSSVNLAEGMARLQERHELERQRVEIELEKKYIHEQRKLLEASIAAEEERRSQVSRTDSRTRVRDWIESADPEASAAESQLPAAQTIQQQISNQNHTDSNAAGANKELPSGLPSGLDIQPHSSPLRDKRQLQHGFA
ncbi:uncharacterized protein LOC134222211 [Armigeres subalbatus]|uniref:uncharacterized protein LOC134222211 n=1 Tax=Armigeres subalbatus TaxID=124917 RepID=UPI002ED42D6F